MIDYLIKIDYVLGYKRFQNRKNAFKPEDTCQILMDVKVGNLGILFIYFSSGIFRKFDMLGNQIAMYLCLVFLFSFFIWAHFKIKKHIDQSPIRKTIKKMSEEEKRKCVILSYVYSLGTMILWILAFMWPVILYGSAAMVSPK